MDDGVSSCLLRDSENGIGTGIGTGTALKLDPGRGGCFGGMSDDWGVNVGGG